MIKISYSEHVWFSDFSIKVFFFFFSFGMKTCLGKEFKTKVNSQKIDRKLALIEVLPIKYDFWVPCTSVETKNILPWWKIARVDSQGKVDVLNLKKAKPCPTVIVSLRSHIVHMSQSLLMIILISQIPLSLLSVRVVLIWIIPKRWILKIALYIECQQFLIIKNCSYFILLCDPLLILCLH